jgi:hypothetical protein
MSALCADDQAKLAELIQASQRDLNCLGDANRSTRSGAMDRLRRKLLPVDSKVALCRFACVRDS